MGEQHKIYLAVPGKRYCWGTVTGVIKSTRAHTAIPYTGGFGFSGQEDFNLLWADAHNAFLRGQVTHFAMLHGDITPDPSQLWLDVLLEEMDGRGAPLVSAVSPIKDSRGLTSTGICDLDDPWRPWRRFTVRELLRMPETFNNALAGYPERPLLHNTGMWVCDLKHPVFQAVNDRGELDLQFDFPTRAVKGEDGFFSHRRESEDWLFSRELWLRGIRDTWVTRRVKLIHHGAMDFGTYLAWGTFLDGDEDTADKWRAELDALPLRPLQLLNFELGRECNLGPIHGACPNQAPIRFAGLDRNRPLDDETIVKTAVRAYRYLGFTGMTGWAYYNEPLLQDQRMFALMERIRDQAREARFILWTNGTRIPEECEAYRAFEQIIISVYNADGRRGVDRLKAKQIPGARSIDAPPLDKRLVQLAPSDPSAPCLRPFVELVIDHFGNTHLCCYDWRGEGTLGNVFVEDWGEIAQRWRDVLPGIAGPSMNGEAPPVCKACGYRWDKYQQHDAAIVDRARRLRQSLGAAL